MATRRRLRKSKKSKRARRPRVGGTLGKRALNEARKLTEMLNNAKESKRTRLGPGLLQPNGSLATTLSKPQGMSHGYTAEDAAKQFTNESPSESVKTGMTGLVRTIV